MKPIVLLSGPVGAGKSTVAAALVAAATEPTVYIEGDLFWSFIALSGKEHPRRKEFRTIMAAMIAAALPFARAGYETIVDFTIPPSFLHVALQMTESRQIPLDFVVIRPTEKLCAARAAGRSEGKIPEYAHLREFYASFDEAANYTISEEEISVSDLAARIREGLTEGAFRVSSQDR